MSYAIVIKNNYTNVHFAVSVWKCFSILGVIVFIYLQGILFMYTENTYTNVFSPLVLQLVIKLENFINIY